MQVSDQEQERMKRQSAQARTEALASDSQQRVVSLQDCLDEINNALNYWYPTAPDASEEERHARHVRLFQFRDRLEKQLKANNDSA